MPRRSSHAGESTRAGKSSDAGKSSHAEKSRAVLFDLDDTLYPQRRFLMSGFAAVARHLSATFDIESDAAWRTMVQASRGADRGHELECVIETFRLPVAVSTLVRVIREHAPSLRLRPQTARTLRQLRDTWSLAIVTNGMADIQRRKVAALGLESLVDTVVYAAEHGSGAGKPDREPFVEALRRLTLDPSHVVFVGDDGRTDIGGAAACGLATIQTVQWRTSAQMDVDVRPDAIVQHIADVPTHADALLSRRWSHHAA